jgi:hypothetical protein
VLDGVDRYIYKSQSTGTQDDFYAFAELVAKQLPSVTPQPKTGHWKYIGNGHNGLFKCDKCGAHRNMFDKLEKYCYSCGAKMAEECG